MTIKLYKTDLSPAARAAMMACEIFNVPVEMVDVNLAAGAQFEPEFLKKNPLHTVPVLEEGDFVLHDSHAILMYLADTFGKDDKMYPKDVKQRGLVNQILLFNGAVLFQRLAAISYPAFVDGKKGVTQKELDRIEEGYNFVEQFLTRTKYVATDHLTIADITVVATVSSLEPLLPLNSEKFPKTQAWKDEISQHDFYQKLNAPGAAAYGTVIRGLLGL